MSPHFLYNVDISKPGILAKSLGYAQIGTGTGRPYNRGIFAWNRENGNDELYQVYNERHVNTMDLVLYL